jgi:hypothetical protein
MIPNLVTSVDPSYALDVTGHRFMCKMCGGRRAGHEHHGEFKKMGGRKGAARLYIERPENRHDICTTCHDAIHEVHSIQTDGFCCDKCPLLQTCFYGSRLLRLPYAHLTPPF